MNLRMLFVFLSLVGGYSNVFAGADKTRVLVNAKIFTVDSRRTWAQAMAINSAGMIVGVGSRIEVVAAAGDNIDIVDLKGRMILPGFQDVHLHALAAGINAAMCEFGADETLADYQWLLRQCIQRNQNNAWIVGSGVNMARLLEKSANPVSVLDAVAKDRPVLILDDIGHGAWANSVALKIIGYDRLPGNPAVLNKYSKTLTAAGFQLHFHVTGDRAAGLALDAIAAAARDTGPHRLSHLYMIDKRDQPRFEKLNAVADFQIPASATDKAYILYMQSLIDTRANQLLPIGPLVTEGATITLSSDWDADELSPLKKLAGVLTRRRQNVADLATAIEMMTINPARLLRQEDRTGSIEVGKYADIVILDRNLFDMRAEQIGKVKVKATLLQGEAVFDPSGLFQ